MAEPMGPAEEEHSLVARSQQGDLDAFNTLVERYQRLAHNVAFRILGDPHLAQDATQEAFIAAYRHIRAFRGVSLRPWLLTIVANACRDILRSPHRKRTISLEELAPDPANLLPSPAESPEEHALRMELGREIQRGLNTIPSDQRMAVILVDIQGLSYEEAAQVTESSLGTLKSRLSRARAHLRDYLRTHHRELLTPQQRQE